MKISKHSDNPLVPRAKCRGLALVELSIAMVIFVIATGMLVQIVGSGQGLRRTAREEWLAAAEAQNRMEVIRSLSFQDIVRNYDRDITNDPNGPGTAPGHTFQIQGLDPTPGDADGMVGEVLLPSINLGSNIAPDWQVREDMDEPLLGLPRDLNGDAIIDHNHHSGDYAILPVLVRIRWKGAYGPRETRLFSSVTQMKQRDGL